LLSRDKDQREVILAISKGRLPKRLFKLRVSELSPTIAPTCVGMLPVSPPADIPRVERPVIKPNSVAREPLKGL
jgi:hypothetical protein